MIKIYSKFLKDFLAIPVIVGKKTPKEKFAGAVTTYTIEAMMKDGRALQSGTSHYLGQNFSKAFNIQFVNRENKKEFAYQTSWGVSTRLIGALIMSHSDNRGIIIPPKIAPNQVDILELFADKNPNVKIVADNIKKTLSRKYRVRLDDSEKGPGFKAGKSEIEGTPLRIEVGPRDLGNGRVTVVRRDTLEKIQVDIKEIANVVSNLLKDIHNNLYKGAKERLDNNIVRAKDYSEFKKMINNKKFVVVPFAGSVKDEETIKKETGASTRCIPFNMNFSKREKCFFTDKDTKRLVIFAKAY